MEHETNIIKSTNQNTMCEIFKRFKINESPLFPDVSITIAHSLSNERFLSIKLFICTSSATTSEQVIMLCDMRDKIIFSNADLIGKYYDEIEKILDEHDIIIYKYSVFEI